MRAISISLLSLLPFVFQGSVQKESNLSQMEIQSIVSNFASDSDPRVRKSALDSLVQMHLRGCPLDLAIYNLSVSCLRDDYEEVRMGGLNLIGYAIESLSQQTLNPFFCRVLSSLYPEHRMKLAHEDIDETTRLIDDAFNKVCDLVNDSAITVRTKACVLMASYHNVGSDMLNQTFSKQIMSHLRRKVKYNSKESRKPDHKKDIIPLADGDIDVESDEFHLLESGACGSFIHGLEDEFQEVRNASIGKKKKVCSNSVFFSNIACRFNL